MNRFSLGNFLSPSRVIKGSSLLFWLASKINRLLFFIMLVLTFVTSVFILKIFITGVKPTMDFKELIEIVESYIYHTPLFAVGLLVAFFFVTVEINLISKFFESLNEALKDIYSFETSYSDEYCLGNSLVRIIYLLENTLILKILIAVLSLLIEVLYMEEIRKIFYNEDASLNRDAWYNNILDLFHLNFTSVLILYILFSVFKVLYEHKNKIHLQNKKLEKESELVI
ncbi:hypothetical protein MRY82_02210 [bacterium]|nr:hypothetical protein [bacterium]